jgi:hypothetical protein
VCVLVIVSVSRCSSSCYYHFWWSLLFLTIAFIVNHSARQPRMNAFSQAVQSCCAPLQVPQCNITTCAVQCTVYLSLLLYHTTSAIYLQVNLAVSLHAANDQERSALLPVNRRFPLSELMSACKEYVDATGKQLHFLKLSCKRNLLCFGRVYSFYSMQQV